MELNSYKLINQNQQLIKRFWSEYTIQKERLNENEFDSFKAHLQTSFYEQIIKSIIVIEKESYSVFEKPKINNSLQELSDIFFKRLNALEDTYWQTFEIHRSKFDNGVTYPDPEDLNEEFVEQFVNKTNIQSTKKNGEESPWDEYKDKPWFKILEVYVTKEIDKIKGNNIDKIEKLFPEVPKQNPLEQGYKYTQGALSNYLGQIKDRVINRKDKEIAAFILYCKEKHNIDLNADVENEKGLFVRRYEQITDSDIKEFFRKYF